MALTEGLVMSHNCQNELFLKLLYVQMLFTVQRLPDPNTPALVLKMFEWSFRLLFVCDQTQRGLSSGTSKCSYKSTFHRVVFVWSQFMDICLSFRGVHHFSGPIELPSCRHQWRQIWQWLSQKQHENQALEWKRVARRFAVTAHRVKQVNWQVFEWFLNKKHRKQDWNFASSIHPDLFKVGSWWQQAKQIFHFFLFQQHLPLPPKGSWGIPRQGEIYNLLIEVWAVPGEPPKGGSQEAL